MGPTSWHSSSLSSQPCTRRNNQLLICKPSRGFPFPLAAATAVLLGPELKPREVNSRAHSAKP